jgi:hypothetical protein
MARWTGTTPERGYGYDHQKLRNRWKPKVETGQVRCHAMVCLEVRDGRSRLIAPGAPWHLGHTPDRTGWTGPEHERCGAADGARRGNQAQPRVIMAGHDVICGSCGKPYHYAARQCEVCGTHYHPSGGTVRTCGRQCGAVLQRRNRMAKGWVPPAQRPKPLRQLRKPGPVASGQRAPAKGWPSTAIAYYACRYCGELGVSKTQGQTREVCPSRSCQLARLTANNLRTRNGITKSDADAKMVTLVASARQW